MRLTAPTLILSLCLWAGVLLWDHVGREFGEAATLYTIHSHTNPAAPLPWPGIARTTNNTIPLTNGGPLRFYYVTQEPVFTP